MGNKHKDVNIIFPDKLEERLEAILNSFNGELKTATFLALDDSPKNGFDLRDAVSESATIDRVLNPQLFTSYCQWSLAPRGLAHETQINMARKFPPSAFGYNITEAGRKYGQPIAALALEYSVKNNISMFSILGSSNSRGRTNCPLNRVKILKKAREGKLRTTDLSEAVNWNVSGNVTKNHLIPLSKAGFIKTESCGELAGALTAYSWISGNIEDVKNAGGYLTKAKIVAAKIKEIGTSDNFALAQVVNLPADEIKKILSGLEEQGFVKSSGRWTDDRKSENEILRRGRKFVEKYISKIEDCLADGPALKELTEFYDHLKNAKDGLLIKEYLNKAVQLYIEASPHMNFRSSADIQERIMRYLKEKPGSRFNEISKDNSLRYATIQLRGLINAGLVRKEELSNGKVVKYYPNN